MHSTNLDIKYTSIFDERFVIEWFVCCLIGWFPVASLNGRHFFMPSKTWDYIFDFLVEMVFSHICI